MTLPIPTTTTTEGAAAPAMLPPPPTLAAFGFGGWVTKDWVHRRPALPDFDVWPTYCVLGGAGSGQTHLWHALMTRHEGRATVTTNNPTVPTLMASAELPHTHALLLGGLSRCQLASVHSRWRLSCTIETFLAAYDHYTHQYGVLVVSPIPSSPLYYLTAAPLDCWWCALPTLELVTLPVFTTPELVALSKGDDSAVALGDHFQPHRLGDDGESDFRRSRPGEFGRVTHVVLWSGLSASYLEAVRAHFAPRVSPVVFSRLYEMCTLNDDDARVALVVQAHRADHPLPLLRLRVDPPPADVAEQPSPPPSSAVAPVPSTLDDVADYPEWRVDQLPANACVGVFSSFIVPARAPLLQNLKRDLRVQHGRLKVALNTNLEGVERYRAQNVRVLLSARLLKTECSAWIRQVTHAVLVAKLSACELDYCRVQWCPAVDSATLQAAYAQCSRGASTLVVDCATGQLSRYRVPRSQSPPPSFVMQPFVPAQQTLRTVVVIGAQGSVRTRLETVLTNANRQQIGLLLDRGPRAEVAAAAAVLAAHGQPLVVFTDHDAGPWWLTLQPSHVMLIDDELSGDDIECWRQRLAPAEDRGWFRRLVQHHTMTHGTGLVLCLSPDHRRPSYSYYVTPFAQTRPPATLVAAAAAAPSPEPLTPTVVTTPPPPPRQPSSAAEVLLLLSGTVGLWATEVATNTQTPPVAPDVTGSIAAATVSVPTAASAEVAAAFVDLMAELGPAVAQALRCQGVRSCDDLLVWRGAADRLLASSGALSSMNATDQRRVTQFLGRP